MSRDGLPCALPRMFCFSVTAGKQGHMTFARRDVSGGLVLLVAGLALIAIGALMATQMWDFVSSMTAGVPFGLTGAVLVVVSLPKLRKLEAVIFDGENRMLVRVSRLWREEREVIPLADVHTTVGRLMYLDDEGVPRPGYGAILLMPKEELVLGVDEDRSRVLKFVEALPSKSLP